MRKYQENWKYGKFKKYEIWKIWKMLKKIIEIKGESLQRKDKCTRKKFILEILPNSLETEDMRKIRQILPNFTVK